MVFVLSSVPSSYDFRLFSILVISSPPICPLFNCCCFGLETVECSSADYEGKDMFLCGENITVLEPSELSADLPVFPDKGSPSFPRIHQ